MTDGRTLFFGLGAISLAATLTAGCSEKKTGGAATTTPAATAGSTGSPGATTQPGQGAAPATEAQTRELLQSTALISQAGQGPFLIVMNQVSPGNFTPGAATAAPRTMTTPSAPSEPAATMISGGPTGGTIRIDYGAGEVVGDTTLRGAMTIDYAAGNGAATIVMGYESFETDGPHGTTVIDGALTLTVAYSGSQATVDMDGTLNVLADGDSIALTLDLRYAFDGASGRTVIDGTTTTSSARHGAWTVTFAGLTVDRGSSGALVITAGSSTLTDSAGAFTASYVFTGPNSGTWSSSAGQGGTFTLPDLTAL